MKKSNTIHRGSIIQVVNPQFITRIGYDFSFDDALKEIRETCKEDIYTLMRKIKVSRWDKVGDEIFKTLAYDLIRKKMKTGNARRIYTERREELIDIKVTVEEKRFVKTGVYYPPCVGEDDCEPGGLNDAKTHVIFEFNEPDTWGKEPLKIEQCNVKLITQ